MIVLGLPLDINKVKDFRYTFLPSCNAFHLLLLTIEELKYESPATDADRPLLSNDTAGYNIGCIQTETFAECQDAVYCSIFHNYTDHSISQSPQIDSCLSEWHQNIQKKVQHSQQPSQSCRAI